MSIRKLIVMGAIWALALPVAAQPAERELVKLPDMMQEHMMANMRDHLQTLDTILDDLAQGEFDQAADLAEQRLGMSSMALHGAAHMAPFMPEPMQAAGTAMHRAASRFSLVAQEGDLKNAVASLKAVTDACVACHAAYRIH